VFPGCPSIGDPIIQGFVVYVPWQNLTLSITREADFGVSNVWVENWRELCIAALDAKDPDEVLQILQELNRALKHEEQVRHDFRRATKTFGSSDGRREHRST
jgi:hypothetical protein